MELEDSAIKMKTHPTQKWNSMAQGEAAFPIAYLMYTPNVTDVLYMTLESFEEC